MASETAREDRRASVTPDQMTAIVAGFASLSPLYLVMADKRGYYVRDALLFRGIEWAYGGELSVLSQREAGFILEALHNSARGVPHA